MTLTWHCLDCPAAGTTDAGAVKHTKDTHHGTVSEARP